MSNPTTFTELMELLPDAAIDEAYDGELVIYTGQMVAPDGETLIDWIPLEDRNEETE